MKLMAVDETHDKIHFLCFIEKQLQNSINF